MSSFKSSENTYLGESGRTFNFSSLSSYYSRSTNSGPVVIRPTYKEILVGTNSFFDSSAASELSLELTLEVIPSTLLISADTVSFS